jgi:hypothetical protein
MPAIAHRWLHGVEGAPPQVVARPVVQSHWQRVRLVVNTVLIGVSATMERGSPNLGGWRV